MLMIPYNCKGYKFNIPTVLGFATNFHGHVKGAFDTLYEEEHEGAPKMMTIALHRRCIGKPARSTALKKIVEYIASKKGVSVVTRTKIAEHFREKLPYQLRSLTSGIKRVEALNMKNGWPVYKDVSELFIVASTILFHPTQTLYHSF